jgi:hypothetical protein
MLHVIIMIIITSTVLLGNVFWPSFVLAASVAMEDGGEVGVLLAAVLLLLW